MENHRKPLIEIGILIHFAEEINGAPQVMVFAWYFFIILKSASRSGQKASKTIGYSDGCANVRIHGAKQGTAGGCKSGVLWDQLALRLAPRWPQVA